MKEADLLTDSLFFDTDCLSAFLWVKNESLLAKLYPGKIIIPQDVYDEFSCPGVAHLKARGDALISAGQAQIMTIASGTDEYNLFYNLTVKPKAGHVIIGKGEASSIVLAKQNDGIVASNNLKDIASYITELGLKHITTGGILREALESGVITEAQGNKIWSDMLCKRRKLGAASFTDYIKVSLGGYNTANNLQS